MAFYLSLKSCFTNNLGPPSAPSNLEFLPVSLTSAVLSWAPSTDFTCVTSYTVSFTCTNVTNGNASYSYNTTTNTTSITVSDLTQETEYFFTVAGIDTGGRKGEESASATVKLDSELILQVMKHSNLACVHWIADPGTMNM